MFGRKTDGEAVSSDRVTAGRKGQGVGLLKDLAELPVGTLISVNELSRILKRHPVSIRRAVTRGELPKPMRAFGGGCWTVGAILDHFEKRLQAAQAAAARDAARIAALPA